ncbi:MAG: hypothetical protein JWM73_755 [Solirubrobacterales bacterium]|nr:hypothetical protein [Solirubrobacterales bacterium]
MLERFNRKSLLAGSTALLATLGFGSAALAQSSTTSAKAVSPAAAVGEAPGQESTAPENSATDNDNVQQGDQSGTDKADGPESATDKADGPESAGDKADGPESANDAPDTGASAQQQGQN